MTDREKVINGLQCCLHDEDNDHGRLCEKCPYDCGDCRKDLYNDTLELLKKQELRVLTWDEVEQAEVCWLENHGFEDTYAELNAADWNPEYYGKAIRCWNYKPTKEQREAVKWDE